VNGRVLSDGRNPLIIITSNEERRLPDAFIRRCLVLRMELPRDDEELSAHLLQRGWAHFPDAEEGLLVRAAKMLIRDRRRAEDEGFFPLPGQAEYFDLLRAVRRLEPNDKPAQLELLEDLADFALKKNAK
jgi:MoxR-like ATPase